MLAALPALLRSDARLAALLGVVILRRRFNGSKIEGKTFIKYHAFVATDTIKNPALMPKYTTN